MKNLFTDFDYRNQLQYKSLIMLIQNQITILRGCQYEFFTKERLRKELLTVELIEIYIFSLESYLQVKGLNATQINEEVESLFFELKNLSRYRGFKFKAKESPMSLITEEEVERVLLKENDAIFYSIKELYDYLTSKMLPHLNSDGTKMIFQEIIKFNKKFLPKNN